jgi:two-component system response regulator LytT
MADGRMTNISQGDIVYVEIMDYTVTHHTAQVSLNLRGTLGEVLAALDGEYFVQIHRSYVIALNKIDAIKTSYPYSVDMLKGSGPVNLPVSRKYIDNLLEAYSTDLLEKMI